MSLGDAAGCAAGLDLDEDAPVQQVDVATLQRRIWARGGAIIYVSDVPPSHPDFAAVQWWGGLGGLHGIEPPREKQALVGLTLLVNISGHSPVMQLRSANRLISLWLNAGADGITNSGCLM